MTQLTHLFSPISVGKVELKNRLIRPAVLSLQGQEGYVSEGLAAFYDSVAAGGVGLIITGRVDALDLGQPRPGRLSIHNDRFIPSLAGLTKRVHAHGAKIGLQISPEPLWTGDGHTPAELVGPSDVVVNPHGGRSPRPLEVEEIQRIGALFAEAARRAREAGFDLVEYHIGTGNLLSQFVSPFTNKRSDGYGGSLEKRMRFPLEVLAGSKLTAGGDFTLVVRVSGADMMPGGHTVDDTALVARILEDAGVAAIDVATGWPESPVPAFQSSVPQGHWAGMAERIKSVVTIPVITGTRLHDPRLADRLIAEGRADMVYMARSLIADPELPNKARQGHFDDIRPCLCCGHCFESVVVEEKPLKCSVNPRIGSSDAAHAMRASRVLDVLVIGGGPAGMEAACVAALRGHRVTLMEREEQLGGQLVAASAAPFKSEVGDFLSYLITQVRKLGVRIELGKAADAALVHALQPDAVILATGSSPIRRGIPGVSLPNVLTGQDVLAGGACRGPRVVIVGGGMVGCEAAEYLASNRMNVTLLETLAKMGRDFPRVVRWVVLQRLSELHVAMETGTRVEEITLEGVWAQKHDARLFYPADAVVLAMGSVANDGLLKELEGRVKALYAVGDCRGPGQIAQAIHAGYRVGNLL